MQTKLLGTGKLQFWGESQEQDRDNVMVSLEIIEFWPFTEDRDEELVEV